jgi:hypothetical protein
MIATEKECEEWWSKVKNTTQNALKYGALQTIKTNAKVLKEVGAEVRIIIKLASFFFDQVKVLRYLINLENLVFIVEISVHCL